MAKRAWVVHPDTEVPGVGPEGEAVAIPAVSLQALANAALEGATVVHRCGGVLSVLCSRIETGYPNERVTDVAMVEWKDRTDARPQPEMDGPDLGAHALVAEPELTDDGEYGLRDADEAAVAAELGLDGDMALVDESSVPARLREG